MRRINNGNWRMTKRQHLLPGVLIMVGALVTLTLGVLTGSSLTAVFCGVAATLEGAFAVGVIALSFEEIDPNKGKFCPACGDKYSPKTTQTGYDVRTGARRTETHFTCLNSTCKSKSPKPQSHASLGSYIGTGGVSTSTNSLFGTFTSPPSWSFTATCHSPRVTTCGSCLDALVADGTLSEAEANLLR